MKNKILIFTVLIMFSLCIYNYLPIHSCNKLVQKYFDCYESGQFGNMNAILDLSHYSVDEFKDKQDIYKRIRIKNIQWDKYEKESMSCLVTFIVEHEIGEYSIWSEGINDKVFQFRKINGKWKISSSGFAIFDNLKMNN